MNERIKDMLEQPVFDRLWDWYNIGPVQRATLEEFAELIIKECLNFCRHEPNDDEYDYYDMGYHSATQKIYKNIKEHFGVTE